MWLHYYLASNVQPPNRHWNQTGFLFAHVLENQWHRRPHRATRFHRTRPFAPLQPNEVMNERMSNSRRRNKKFLIPFTLFFLLTDSLLFTFAERTHLRFSRSSTGSFFMLWARCRREALCSNFLLFQSHWRSARARAAMLQFILSDISFAYSSQRAYFAPLVTLSAQFGRAVFATFHLYVSTVRGVLAFGRRATPIVRAHAGPRSIGRQLYLSIS